jgi:hypothetical protein
MTRQAFLLKDESRNAETPANEGFLWRRWESNPRPRAREGQLLRA